MTKRGASRVEMKYLDELEKAENTKDKEEEKNTRKERKLRTRAGKAGRGGAGVDLDRGTAGPIDLEHQNPLAFALLYSFWAINYGLMISDANINTRMSLMSTLTANDLRDNHPIQSPRFQTKRCGNPLIPNKIRRFDSQRVDKFPFSLSQSFISVEAFVWSATGD